MWVGWVAMMAVGKAGRQSRAAETHWHVALLALSCPVFPRAPLPCIFPGVPNRKKIS